jgi:hypothetical protein
VPQTCWQSADYGGYAEPRLNGNDGAESAICAANSERQTTPEITACRRATEHCLARILFMQFFLMLIFFVLWECVPAGIYVKRNVAGEPASAANFQFWFWSASVLGRIGETSYATDRTDLRVIKLQP